MREAHAAETAWAPPCPADELRTMRFALVDQAAVAARARGDHDLADQHHKLAASARVLGDWYRQRADIDAAQVEDYRAWTRVTEGTRHLAVLADAELRRRNPRAELPELATAEPEPPPAELPELPDSDAELAGLAEAENTRRAEFRERLEARQGVRVPHPDHEREDLSEAWPSPWEPWGRDAILKPPPPQLQPARCLQRQADAEAEAGL